jgi:hypothetical protein
MKAMLGATVLVGAMVATFAIYLYDEDTICFSNFASRAEAERAAARAEALLIDVEVEARRPDARRSHSKGGRAIAVDFRSGRTGDGAASFRTTVRRLASEEGALGKRKVGCTERGPRD